MSIIDIIWNCAVIRYKKIQIGKNPQIAGRLFAHGKKRGIQIGDNVVINSRTITAPIAGGNHTHLRTGENGRILIGNNVGMSHANINAFAEIILEDNVMLGSCVKIWDTDFHSIHYDDRVNGDINAVSKPIRIKEGAFIGACSIILKGVTIGRHSVIGAGSVVAKDVPDGEIWAGNPAKFIRRVET